MNDVQPTIKKTQTLWAVVWKKLVYGD